MSSQRFWCRLHGDYSDDCVISIGSDPEGEPDQCGQCIAECEEATWD